MKRQDAMTSVQNMFAGSVRRLCARSAQRALGLGLVLMIGIGLGGCSGGSKDRLDIPHVLVSPYDTRGGDVLWAIVPLANESGTSVADSLEVSDQLVAAVTQARGLAAVPMNRTLAAMRSLGLAGITSPGQARALANAMGVDGVLIGTITAYDPYDPPTIGISVALFAREGSMGIGEAYVDPVALSQAHSDYEMLGNTQFADDPVAVVNEHLHGASHEVQLSIQHYATGRFEHGSAWGWRRYLASMDLYTKFAAHQTVRRLLEKEQIRVGRLIAAQQAAAR